MTTKSFTFFCAVVLIAIALCAGGVFAAFAYARSDVEPKSEYLNKYIDLEYPTFTQAMTDMMNFADGTEILGLNSVAYYAQFTDPDARKSTTALCTHTQRRAFRDEVTTTSEVWIVRTGDFSTRRTALPSLCVTR